MTGKSNVKVIREEELRSFSIDRKCRKMETSVALQIRAFLG